MNWKVLVGVGLGGLGVYFVYKMVNKPPVASNGVGSATTNIAAPSATKTPTTSQSISSRISGGLQGASGIVSALGF